MNNELMFGSAGDERGTPQDFFDTLNKEFNFDIDLAASPHNHKCELWFGEGGVAFDALEQDWGGLTGFLNPPYSIAGSFVTKAREEADKGAIVVMLLPVRSDTKWWHSYVYDSKTYEFRPGVQCRLLPGRLSFELQVPATIRQFIKSELRKFQRSTAETETQIKKERAEYEEKVRELVKTTGLPKMAVERIDQDVPDDCLMESAPFPSCIVIFSKQ